MLHSFAKKTTMSPNKTSAYLLAGFESFQNNTLKKGKEEFHTLDDLMNYMRNMNLQQEYFDILDVKAGKQIDWMELN